MRIQTPQERSNELQGYTLAFSARLAIGTILLLFTVIGVLVGVFNSLRSAIPLPILLSVGFAVLCIVFLLLQRFLPLSYGPLKTDTLLVFDSPPLVDSRIIQPCEDTVKDIYAKLTQSQLSAIILTGIGGVGKSTLAALLYRYAEEQRQANNSPFISEALWIKVDEAFTIASLARILFRTSGLLVPDFSNMSSSDQAAKLLDALNNAKATRLIVLDQFEHLLDEQTGQVLSSHSGIGKWIALLNEQQCGSRVLIISRFWPRNTLDASIDHTQEYRYKGLGMIEGVKLLRKLEAKGSEEELRKLEVKGSEERRRAVVVRCGGHPLALILLASFLRHYELSLTAFSRDPILIKLWIDEVGHRCFASLYEQRLYPIQQKLLLAFSVYREAVPLQAAKDIIDFDNELPREQMQPILDVLLMHHLLQESGEERYQLYPLVAVYVQNHFVEGNTLANEQSLRAAHAKAAQYYRQHEAIHCPPKDQRQSAKDVYPFVEIVWHLCHAHQYKEAYRLMQQEDIFPTLRHWGRNKTLLSLYLAMLPLDNWHPPFETRMEIYHSLGRVYTELGQNVEAKKYLERAMTIIKETREHGEEEGKILADLGRACSALGEKKEARKYLEHALGIVRARGDREEEGKVLNRLGLVYDDLGERDQARNYLGQALRINQEVENRWEESLTFDNLGVVYNDLGQQENAMIYYQQALSIRGELGDRRGVGVTLRHLGRTYADLGKYQDARESYKEAVSILQEVGDLREEGRTLDYLGQVYAEFEQYEEALEHYWWALNILREVEDRWEESKTLNHMVKVYQKLGRKEEAQQCYEVALALSRKTGDRKEEGRILNSLVRMHDDPRQKEEIQKYLKQALEINREVGDLRGLGQTLNNLGQIDLDLGREEEAHEHYKEAYRIHKEVKDNKGIAWTLRNIGVLYHKQRHLDAALASLLVARQIFDEVQSPDREEAQKAIDALRKDIGRRRFNELSKRIAPQAPQIVEQKLGEGV